MTPEELVQLGLANGLSALAITDHDNANSYLTALPASKLLGIKLLSGIEFSASFNGISVHILGYSFAFGHPAIQELSHLHDKRRDERNKLIIDSLKENGMPVDYEALKGAASGTIGRPHIAQLMLEKGYVPDIKTAFKKYIGDGCPCYHLGNALTVEETIECIHKANGFAVIAHPQLISKVQTLKALLQMDFDGIECYYSNFSKAASEGWVKIAKERNLMITGGSDFHGAIKPKISLGASWISEEYFAPLWQRFCENAS